MHPVLTIDMGGTKTEFALLHPSSGGAIECRRRYQNDSFASAGDLFDQFQLDLPCSPEAVVVAVAGVVRGKAARMTNRAWTISRGAIEARWGGVETVLVNDMTALAHAVTGLGSHELVPLSPGELPDDDVRVHAVIAPGTGLGEGYFVDHPTAPFACGTEGGHTEFAPTTALEQELLEWMRQRTGRVSCESLISGPGLTRLYDFAVERLGHPPCAGVNGQGEGRSPQIVAAALADSPVCLFVIELFLQLLGSEAGNLALKTYATGGVYLGGGILPRLFPHCSSVPLVEAFLAKDEMRPLMKRIPLHLITSDAAIHLGAATWLSRRKQLLQKA